MNDDNNGQAASALVYIREALEGHDLGMQDADDTLARIADLVDMAYDNVPIDTAVAMRKD